VNTLESFKKKQMIFEELDDRISAQIRIEIFVGIGLIDLVAQSKNFQHAFYPCRVFATTLTRRLRRLRLRGIVAFEKSGPLNSSD
jgi:hypothetical protein